MSMIRDEILGYLRDLPVIRQVLKLFKGKPEEEVNYLKGGKKKNGRSNK